MYKVVCSMCRFICVCIGSGHDVPINIWTRPSSYTRSLVRFRHLNYLVRFRKHLGVLVKITALFILMNFRTNQRTSGKINCLSTLDNAPLTRGFTLNTNCLLDEIPMLV